MTSLEIIHIIVAARRQSKMTQAELAARAGISRRTMLSVESGSHDIGFRKLERILNALGLGLSVVGRQRRPTEAQLAEMFKDDDD